MNELEAGAEFAGFEVERRLGRGGMGTVYLARHPRLPKAVALKVLNRDLAEDAAIRRRFDLEAAIAARLEHRNIVTVLDRGIADSRLWIAMQYVDGADAATAIPTLGMEPEHAVRIVTAAAAALDHAHAAGVVHRDVKPANILLAEDGRVFLSDFGIARAVDGSNRLTQTGAVLGTLDYASPEQLSAADVDGRSDQYSLGCTLFHLLTGRTPYSAAHFGAVLSGHLSGPVPLPSSVRPGLVRFDPVLVRAMAKRVDEQFATCGELADALTEALTGTGPVTGNRVRSRTPRPDAERGSDALIRMELTLEECARGTTKHADIETAVLCERCSGDGVTGLATTAACEQCAGTGYTERLRWYGRRETAVCEKCAGTGCLDAVCPVYGGEGRYSQRVTKAFRIPAGTRNGVRVRMAGQGEVGPRGGSEGDLYVEVIELPHPTYQRAGDNDLRCTITLSRAEAWQGTTVIVDDIVDGPFPVVVPPGTEPGNGVIVYGRGMPQLGAPGTRGALNVHLDIN